MSAAGGHAGQALDSKYYCPFCGHTWKDVGISKCHPPVYIATCPMCLAFGFPMDEGEGRLEKEVDDE